MEMIASMEELVARRRRTAWCEMMAPQSRGTQRSLGSATLTPRIHRTPRTKPKAKRFWQGQGHMTDRPSAEESHRNTCWPAVGR